MAGKQTANTRARNAQGLCAAAGCKRPPEQGRTRCVRHFNYLSKRSAYREEGEVYTLTGRSKTITTHGQTFTLYEWRHGAMSYWSTERRRS